jgi:hypothetical protein
MPNESSLDDPQGTPEWAKMMEAMQAQFQSQLQAQQAQFQSQSQLQSQLQAQQAQLQAQLQAMNDKFEQSQAQPRVEDVSGATAGQAASSPSSQASADEVKTEPTPEARPAESDKHLGRLDTATLNCFPLFGSGDLYYAEEWIAEAEILAEKLRLDKQMLCRAFCLRAIGEVKTYLELFGDKQKGDWSSLCNILHKKFGRAVRIEEYNMELLAMDKIAGMELGPAVARFRMLVDATDHPPKNLSPVWIFIRRFSDDLRREVTPQRHQWKTCQEALDDLDAVVGDPMLQGLKAKVIATPAPKTSTPGTKIGTVAAVEPAGTLDQAEPVAATARATGKPMRGAGRRTMKCYRCLKPGHFWNQCPIKVEEEGSNDLPKNWVG